MPFVKGQVANPWGRPKQPEIELFRKALAWVEDEKRIPLLVHAVRRAYKNDGVLIALIKKILPENINIEARELSRLIIVRPNEVRKLLEEKIVKRLTENNEEVESQ